MPPRCSILSYYAALIDKHHLLERLPSPKIIFVGGSNLAFGLDSELIEQKLHMPVVNMGLCSTFGLRYVLEEVKDNINAWDLIVIVPEYDALDRLLDGYGDICQAIEVYPPSAFFVLRACSQNKEYSLAFTKLVCALPAAKWKAFFFILDRMRQESHFSLDLLQTPKIPIRYCFNQQGDQIGHLSLPNRPFKLPWGGVKIMSPASVELLNNFDKFVRQRRARVIILPPPLPTSHLNPPWSSAQDIADWPDKKIRFPVLARPVRYAFPSSDFYEQPYHLNAAGRAQRTALVIEDLEQYFAKLKNNVIDPGNNTYP